MESSKKVKIVKLLDYVTLEGTEADTQAATSRVIVDTYVSDQLNLVCKYTTGSTETNNTAHIKIWGYAGEFTSDSNYPYSGAKDSRIKADSDNWIQIGEFNSSDGTATFQASTFDIVGAAAGTTYDAHFAFGITWPKIRISAYEEGVASKKGRLTCVALIQ